jgi:hypothetical protein
MEQDTPARGLLNAARGAPEQLEAQFLFEEGRSNPRSW